MAKPSSNPKIVTKKHIARQERERRQSNLIRAIAFGGILIVVLLLAYGYLKLNVLQLRDPVAKVNGEIITTGQWQERVQLQRINLTNLYSTYVFYQQSFWMDTSQQQQQIQSVLQSPLTLGQQVLYQMIDEALIRQEAKTRGITVSTAEVEEAIQEAYRFFPNGTKTPTVTPTTFSFPTPSSKQLTLVPWTSTPTPFLTSTPAPTNTPDPSITPTVTSTPTATSTTAPPTPTSVPQAATATSTPYTLEGFNAQYTKTLEEMKASGIREETLRSVYEAGLLRDKLLEVIATDVPHTEEQVWARHILVDDASLADTVRTLLLDGKDFAEVAKEYSKDTGSAANGGDLGWFTRSAMVPEFAEAAFSQKIGEIGEVVQSQFGYHVIQVIDRQELPVSASQYEQNRQTAFTDWLAKAREDADLTTYDYWKERVPTEPPAVVQPQ